MYKLYAQNKIKGWELIKTSNDLDELNLISETLKPKEYYEYLIVEHSGKGDRTIRRQELYQECQVEYVEDIETKVTIKAIVFKPSRMKEKEELRKEIDRSENE